MTDDATLLPDPKSWDTLRKKMLTSILVDTKLKTLSVDLDHEVWPIEDEEETPAKYVYYTIDQLKAMPEFEGQPQLIKLLYDIINSTIEMDDPFDDISVDVEESHTEDYSFDDVFEKLNINTSFPLELICLPREIYDVMQNMGVKDLKEFMTFSQKVAQKVHLKGDLRSYINAVVNIDENAIAGFIPYRPKTKGLHLAESLGLIVKGLAHEERWAMLHHYEYALTEGQSIAAKRFTTEDIKDLKTKLFDKFDLANRFFADQKDALVNSMKSDRDIMRLFLSLDDMASETLSVKLFKDYYKISITESGAVEKQKKKGFFASLFGKK